MASKKRHAQHYGPADEILFPEDLKWLEIPLLSQNPKCAEHVAKTVRTLRRKTKNVALGRRVSWAYPTGKSGVSGPPPVQIDFVGSTRLYPLTDSTKPTPKRNHCGFCGGPVDADQKSIRVREGRGFMHYHEWCLDYKLNRAVLGRLTPSRSQD